MADSLELPDLPVARVEKSCATGDDAVRNALFRIAWCAFDAQVMGANKMRDTTSRDMLWKLEAMARDMAWDYPLGVVSPAGFALHVSRYLHDSPATREHMTMGAVKNHRHGVESPKALRFEITMERAARWAAQLRSEAANQVDGARIALGHNVGGPAAVAAVAHLEGDGSGAG